MAGETITAVAAACLRGEFDWKEGASDEQNGVILQSQFGDKIIKRLDGLSF